MRISGGVVPGGICRSMRLRDRRDLRVGGADVDARLEEDLDDADAGIGVGLDVLDVVDGRGQRALERRDDAARHLVRRQAGVAARPPRSPGCGCPGKMSTGVRSAASGPMIRIRSASTTKV